MSEQNTEKAQTKEIEHTEDYSHYRFVCIECDWSGPWWADWESAGRDGVHHYGVTHPAEVVVAPEKPVIR